ncbi:hypothetical protein IMCC26256_111073 [Actinobacteria bacterium IMCC26256]|nr:hypothetical protein IMCC26256_111073 [Actinobacteria bacterium IMCC26256]
MSIKYAHIAAPLKTP